MSYKVIRVTIAEQAAAMGYYVPDFSQRRENGVPTWRQILQPADTSPRYSVKVAYRIPKTPRVWVLAPAIDKVALHRYGDNSLCLFYPPDWSWSSNEYIAKTIVPWTALWLMFYEMWLVYGEWFGPEAPHLGAKTQL